MKRLTRPPLILVALAALLLIAACGSDDETTAPAVWTPKVLVLSDGGTEGHVLSVLGAAGMDTTRGGLWYEDPLDSLYLYDAVVLLNGEDYSNTMTDVAMARLVQFVASGGGVITTEWLMYYASSRNTMLTDIMPVLESEDYQYEQETLRPVTTHPLAAGLPTSMVTGPDWSWVTLIPDTTAVKNARVAVTGDIGGPAVVTGAHGTGRTVTWGMAGVYRGTDIWSSTVEQLLVRIVVWAAGG